MDKSAFLRIEFYLLVVFSLLLPFAVIFFQMIAKRVFSRNKMLLLAMSLVTMSGIDIVLLRKLSTIAEQSSGLMDDIVFSSEFSVALYLLPLILGRTGH